MQSVPYNNQPKCPTRITHPRSNPATTQRTSILPRPRKVICSGMVWLQKVRNIRNIICCLYPLFFIYTYIYKQILRFVITNYHIIITYYVNSTNSLIKHLELFINMWWFWNNYIILRDIEYTFNQLSDMKLRPRIESFNNENIRQWHSY